MTRGKLILSLMLVVLVVPFALPTWVMAAPQPTTAPVPQPQPTTAPVTAPQPTSAPAAAPQHPYLGVRMEDTVSGVIVREVIGGSPAATAGLQMDDIVQKINTKTIANVYQAMEAIDSMKPGDQLTLEISRGGKTQSLTATLKGVTEQIAATLPSAVPFDAIGYESAKQTWQVYSIAQTSELYTAGLRQGDVLTQFNAKAYSPADLQTFINGLHDTDNVKVTLERAGKPTDVQVAAAPLRALNVLNYEDEGLMFGVVPSNTTNVQPTISRLPTGVPFDAIVYDSADQYWFVLGLEENGALYTAGLRMGDHITKFDGKAYSPADLQKYREPLADTATITLSVERAGKSMDVKVSAANLNVLGLFDAPSGAMLFGLPTTTSHVWLGADIRTVTADLAKQLQLKANEGAFVIGVMPDSPAAKAGLQANDVISAIGQDAVKNAEALQQLLSSHKPGDKINLAVLRGDKTQQIDATLGQPEISGEISFLMPAQ